ncbi:MAG: hypothetical protein JWP97_5781, partial [Labilithrix sp.]|nr:hypothetical protein [Labilithrix sp.]
PPAPADRGGEASPDEDLPQGDASTRFRDASPGAGRDLDGPPGPGCTGGALSFAEVVTSEPCAIDRVRAERLRTRFEAQDGGRGVLLVQEAEPAGPGAVTLRLVNKGSASATLPLSFHGKLPAFSVLAEDAHHTIYELAPPALALADPGQGARAHFAAILLLPGGSAAARLTVLPAIAKVLGRGATDPCKARPDGGACAAAALPAGHYVLHVGQLLADVEAGPPARVEVDLP